MATQPQALVLRLEQLVRAWGGVQRAGPAYWAPRDAKPRDRGALRASATLWAATAGLPSSCSSAAMDIMATPLPTATPWGDAQGERQLCSTPKPWLAHSARSQPAGQRGSSHAPRRPGR